MVTMSSSFTLPPVIRRFGRCGEWEQRMPSSSPSSPEIGESSHTGESIYGSKSNSASKPDYGGADRVKSFVNGIVSPFTACWQPTDGAACGPVCADPIFHKQPSVVSPHLDRVISYRDTRNNDPQEDYYSKHSRHHRNYHRHPGPAPNYPPSRREPADAEESATTTTITTTDKKKRNTDIAKPHSNDILCGRGGSSNRHLGNIHFRELVAANKQIYVGLTKKQKMLVARKIVDAIHKTGGRFLAKDLDTGMFYDIGLPRSLEKTSQALREKHSNEMPVQQVVEDEGIETSVESHNSLIKNNISTDGCKGAAGESTAEATSSKGAATTSSNTSTSSKGSKNNSNSTTEAPDLIIPPHLMKKFGPKGSGAHEEDWESNHQHSLSPRSYHSDPSYDCHRSPYPPSPYRNPPGSSPPAHKGGYPPPGHPPPGHHHHHPRYPPSPNNQYPHPHYYYPPGHPPQTPPYGRRGRDERYPYPDREGYSGDYYQRAAPHSQYHRYPRPAAPPRHHGHPVPHVSPHPPAHGAPLPRPGYGPQQVASPPPQLPPYRPSPHSSYYRHGNGETGPPPLPRNDAPSSSPPSRVIYRNTNNGYVRANSDVSPGRQRELKRPRNGKGEPTTSKTVLKAQTSDVSLSSAVKHSLSLDDRVVGKERERLQQQKENNSGPINLVSPSTMLQAKSFSRSSMVVEDDRSSPPEKKEQDYSALSGLAALSTAAFLKLDEDGDAK